MSGRAWTTVRVKAPEDRIAVAAALFELGVEAIQELDDDLVTHVDDADGARVTDALRRLDPGVILECSPTPDVDWSSQWKSRITAHRLGRLVVTPPWSATDYATSERIVIDPGMAFGTGEHETTRGVLRLMQRVIRSGDVVADVGSGSAVLSIAAALLGARRVVAIEIDPDAIGNAEENIRANNVAERVSVIEGDAFAVLPLVAPVRVVLANLVSSLLIELLPVIRESLAKDGTAILSGILAEERLDMERSIASAGWRVIESDAEGAWWSVTIAAA